MPPTRSLKAVVIVAALGFLIACGSPQNTGVDSITTTGDASDPESATTKDFAAPPPFGAALVSSEAAAANYLAFTPRQPNGLGTPQAIYAQTGGPDSERKFRIVAFVFDSQKYGLIRVTMEIDRLTAEQRRASSLSAVSRNSDPNTRGRAEITMIKGGTEALLGYPPDGLVNISWREGPILVVVRGLTLTREQAIEIAENL